MDCAADPQGGNAKAADFYSTEKNFLSDNANIQGRYAYCNPPWLLAYDFINKFEATKEMDHLFKAVLTIPDKPNDSEFQEFV